MKSKIKWFRVVTLLAIIAAFIVLSNLIIRDIVAQGIEERNYILQNETVARKAAVVENYFTDRTRSLAFLSQNTHLLPLKNPDGFFEQVFYRTAEGDLLGDFEGYTSEFVNTLKKLKSYGTITTEKHDGVYHFIYMTPAKGGDCIGILSAEDLRELLSDNHSGHPSRNVLSLPDGTALVNSDGAVDMNKGRTITNILGRESRAAFYSEEEYNTVISKMQDPLIKSFTYRMQGGEGVTLVSVSRVGNTPFILTQYLSSHQTVDMQMEKQLFYTNMAVVAVFCVLLFLILTQLYNTHEKKALARQAKIDTMTGLLNHNAFIDGVDEVLSEKESGALLILDLDEFKTINDTYGHLFGDSIIKKTASCISDLFQDGEILGRFGGDEFVIYASKEASRETVCKKADALLHCLGQITLPNGEGVSGSIGISCHRDPDITAAILLKQADVALYQSKNRGKNRYTLYCQEQ